MKQIFQDLKSGKIYTTECPYPTLSKGSLISVSTKSLISKGTEGSIVNFGKSNYFEKAKNQPERVKQVIDKVKTDGISATLESVSTKLNDPMPLGYSNVGIIEEIDSGITSLRVGDRIVSNGPHASIVKVNELMATKIPDNVDDSAAAFTVPGAIALNAVRLANPCIGENFVVIGAGLIGLLVIQILNANGCNVCAIDIDEEKLNLAKNYGASIIKNTDDAFLADSVNEIFQSYDGVDGVIIAASSRSNEIMSSAAKISRKKGRIILLGDIGLEINRADFYEKELSFQVSCSYGPGRYDKKYEQSNIDYPLPFVRWTMQRNFSAFLDLLANHRLNVSSLITNEFSFSEPELAYQKILTDPQSLGIMFNYENDDVIRDKSLQIFRTDKLETKSHKKSSSKSVAIIGAGNFTSRVLGPALKKLTLKLLIFVAQDRQAPQTLQEI